jgi:hypothetical protein
LIIVSLIVVLAVAGCDNTGVTAIKGNIGVSPADMTPPTPSNMTTAISGMETAYTDAAGRTTPDYTDLGAGEIGGETHVPGLNFGQNA